MSDSINIAIDAMGGDNALTEPVKACVEAVKNQEGFTLTLVGDEAQIQNELNRYSGFPADRIRIRHASQVIETAEAPVTAIKAKKDSSIVVGLNMVKNHEADALISSGSTGALLVGGIGIVGRIRGVERTPVGVIIPNAKGITLLLDSGANVDSRASHLVQFAQMGSIYMEHVVGIKNPSVGIVNNGAEEEKGNALVKEAFPLLKACEEIRFIGSVEARDIPAGAADVVVCEGFVGNVILKMYEGTASTLLSLLKTAMTSSLKNKIGALLIKNSLKDMLKTFDATEYGGAPFLGLKGLVVKTHGNAKAKELHKAILQSVEFSRQDIQGKIASRLGRKESNE